MDAMHPRPVAAYSFEEGEGETAGDTAGNHDGSVKGGATWTEEGRHGGALDFDGADDKVVVADASDLDLTGAFTLEAWVAPDTAFKWRPLISKTYKFGGAESAGYALFTSGGSNKPEGYAADGSGFAAIGAPSALELESWTHLALTSDEETLRLYVDGEEVASEAAIAASPTETDLEIGRIGGVLNTYFGGRIDDVRIYDEQLTEAQIQADRDTSV